MTRAALHALPPVEALAVRWAVFARAVKPIIRTDFDAKAQDLADEEKPPSKSALAARRGVRREELTQGRIAQAKLRKVLALDDEDET